MDCNEIAKGEALANGKMEFLWNTVVKRFEGTDRLNKVVLKNLKTDAEIPLEVPTCFEFIGYIPNTEIFKGIIDLTERGYIVTNENKETNMEGVFAVGDVTEKLLKQVATAVGDGAVAGVGAERFIAESETVKNQILGKEGIVFAYDASDGKSHERLRDIETIEEMSKGKFAVTRVDVYKSKGISSRLGIHDFPKLAIIKDGKVHALLNEDFSYNEIVNYFD
jgi:thioredoxin reductase (NADPH)